MSFDHLIALAPLAVVLAVSIGRDVWRDHKNATTPGRNPGPSTTSDGVSTVAASRRA